MSKLLLAPLASGLCTVLHYTVCMSLKRNPTACQSVQTGLFP